MANSFHQAKATTIEKKKLYTKLNTLNNLLINLPLLKGNNTNTIAI